MDESLKGRMVDWMGKDGGCGDLDGYVDGGWLAR